MKLTHLLQPWITKDIPAIEIKGLQNDSRSIKPEDLFMAYRGTVTDGRLFIEKAQMLGAAAILYDPTDFTLDATIAKALPCIAISDLSTKLSAIANRFYDNPTKALKATGVTGTNGKTTIAYQLAQAHTLLQEKAAYIGTIGQGEVGALEPLNMTTPDGLSLLTLIAQYRQKNIKHLCMEVSSHALAQHRVDAIPFSQAIFTNLTLDHLDYHHNMEDYAAAKARLFGFESLEYAIINEDDAYQEAMCAAIGPHVKRLTYGLGAQADVRAKHWQTSIGGSHLEVSSPWGEHKLQVSALGQFNIYNTLALWSSLLVSGYEARQLLPIMAKLSAAPGRMEIVSESPYVIVDYSHTPDALEKALTTLQALKKGNLWVVFGCGGNRDTSKRPVMGAIASQYADKVVITSDNPRCEDPETIIKAIAMGATNNVIAKLVNRKEAILYALERAKTQDIILIAGKGHEAYQEIDTVKYPFSDQDIVKEFMAKVHST